jgi:ATP-dependent RNA helicase SUPV3L1/SUV3
MYIETVFDFFMNNPGAVIDEIQMIGSEDRGWAWTRVLLGLQAKEIHICGDPSALSIIERIARYLRSCRL